MPVLTLDNEKHAKILRKPCKKVKDFGSTEFLILIQEMIDVASHPGAAGVAAPQLGSNLRVIAISVDKKYPPIIMVNPVIRGLSEETKEVTEGCLSAPGKIAKLTRHLKINLSWQDTDGKTHSKKGNKYEMEFDGFFAQALQHECDHIDGIVCVDRADEVYNSADFEKSFKEAKESELNVDKVNTIDKPIDSTN